MADIKVKKKDGQSIKTIDRTAMMGSKIKSNIVDIKEKTKETYEKNENSGQEYAENKVESGIQNATYYSIRTANKIGKKSAKRTMENIKNTRKNIQRGKQQIKKAKESIKKVKKAGERTVKTIKKSIKTAKQSIKATRRTIKTAEKTTKATIKTTKQVAKTTVKVAQRTAQATKVAIKATIKTIQVAIKVAIAIIKMIIAVAQALISAIIAGGWVAVLIIVIIAIIALICTSIFGIFFSNEKEMGDITMSSVVREINEDFTNKITEIQRNTAHDDYEINSNRASWKDVLSVYAVEVSNGEEQTEVITLDDKKMDKLKKIFWEMNNISSRTEEIEKEIEIINDDGSTEKKKVKRKVLYIDITSKSVEEMMELYNFNDNQRIQIAELQKDEYNSLWSSVIYGISSGDSNIVAVALAQLETDTKGGNTYWSWYGFENRVEWCACFVSWCANECGYIEAGIIPKFAGCESEGVAWFKTCGLWKDGGYAPKSRRYYIF